MKRVAGNRRAAETNSAGWLDRIDPAANQAQSVGCQRRNSSLLKLGEELLLFEVGATTRLLNFFGRASKRSRRS
jgi:hypothetical protein